MSYYSMNFDHSNAGYYDCVHCKQRVWRESNKQWVKSYCKKADRVVHLQKAK